MSGKRATTMISFLICLQVLLGERDMAQAFAPPSGLPHQINTKINRQLVKRYYGDLGAGGKRAAEIRRKIAQLKKEGRLKKQQQQSEYYDELDEEEDEVAAREYVKDEYGDKVLQKLGEKRSKLLGYTGKGKDVVEESATESEQTLARMGKLGALPTSAGAGESEVGGYRPPTNAGVPPIINPDLFDDAESDGDDQTEPSEEDLVDMVAQKMMEKRDRERREKDRRLRDEARQKLAEIEKERKQAALRASEGSSKQLTSGVGGSWKKNETADVEMYQPKTGSWGAFPRPKDISKTFGGGRRVGPGYSNEEARKKSDEDTRERLRRYREKVGIDVQSEKDHAPEIEEALKISGMAMQRGMYSTAVSALEKVTKFCSTNSRVGGKVFLELAMAYEAVGRTDEAITVYGTLTRSRIDDIKSDAKRLLYGIEAMQFMRKEMKDSNFSRKKAKNTFIDTTGLKNIAQNFDDVYQTAYIDLEGGFYKRLTESVVRSPREARQILLRATDAGEVGRMRIVQALRSLSRNFEDALEKELERRVVKEPVAVMDGKPILNPRRAAADRDYGRGLSDEFVLMDPEQISENLNGEWRLQLLADKKGDGVKFFNNTSSWQRVDMAQGQFVAETPVGFGNAQVSGSVELSEKRRVLRRRSVQTTGGGVFAGLVNPMAGASGALRAPQQVMTVDSVLLVTRGVPSTRRASTSVSKDDGKDYFAVWRRVE